MPAPPSTGDPIADRAIQLAQLQFQQPNGFPTGAFDHAGLGQQAIAETLERLTGVSREQVPSRSSGVRHLPMNGEGLTGMVNNTASVWGPRSGDHQPMPREEFDSPESFLDRFVASFNGGEEDGEHQRISDEDLEMLEALRDDPRRTREERRLLQRLIDTGLSLKETVDPDDESRTLKAAFLPGRQIDPDGTQESLSPDEIKVLAKILASSVSERPKAEMPIGVNKKPVDGAVVSIGRGDRGNFLNFLVAEKTKSDKDLVYAHETGHALDYRSQKNPTEDSRDWILEDAE